jgi:nicotinamidase-related amidase
MLIVMFSKSSLHLGPLGRQTAHLCVDMQNVFMPGSVWGSKWGELILPAVARITGKYAERTVRTRFLPPVTPEERPGMWRRYFERWRNVNRDRMPAEAFDIVRELARFTPPAVVLDKPTYSPFWQLRLREWIASHDISGFVVNGAETDVCILAAVMAGVDLGLRMTIVTDAVASSSDPSHDALLSLYATCFSEQIDTVGHEELLECWNP